MEIQESQLSGDKAVVWHLFSDNETRGSLNLMKPANFIVACQKNETKVIFDFHDYMGPDHRDVAYRADQDPIKKQSFGASEGGEAIGMWFGTGVKWLKSLSGKKRLVIEVKAYNEPAVEGVFLIDGIDTVVASIGKACHWK